MDATATLILIGFLLFFAVIIYLMSQSSRKDKQRKQELAQTLGFVPAEITPELTARFTQLYERQGIEKQYELRHVFQKGFREGVIYLFDLVETSSDNNNWTEQQAVAIISPHLQLPSLAFFPKVVQNNFLGGLANKMVEWGMARMGNPVSLPEFPAFTARYVVTSQEPELARRFFNETVAHHFAQTQMYTLHARGDIFTFSEMDPQFKPNDPERMNERINRALEIFNVLRSKP